MRKILVGLASLTLVTGAGLTAASPAQAAPPTAGASPLASTAAPSDELPNPLEAKRRELRERGLAKVMKGQARAEKRGASTVVKVGTTPASTKAGARSRTPGRRDQYVELKREKTDRIFVVLAEFGNERHPSYPDQDTDPATPGPRVFDGPLHNQIPQPDRTVDNSTVWRPDYSASYYRDLYFGTSPSSNSVKKYYEKQSSGRYSVRGTVTDWVKVRYNEARYGRSNGYPCAGIVCSNTWNLVQDGLNRWVLDQQAKGLTTAQIAAELRKFDEWDRYDHDGDGDFNEPDGYLDHFQIVHAGGDQADGDPNQGEDAIWSHRWYAFYNLAGSAGPATNPLGGTQVGNTGLWVGDYTIQPENGGLSVFVHEYGHDLGLPDLYDTAGGENSVNWWSLMAQSRVSGPGEPLGVRAADLGAWEKLQLGWLDYEVALAGRTRTIDLGPHEYNSPKAQALVVVLPKKQVVTDLGAPYAGQRQWWSGRGDELNNSMTRSVALPAGATLSFQARYDIEDCGPDPCDYAYVEVDAGGGFQAIPGSITKPDEGNGIDGTSNGWVPATFDLSAYGGKTVQLRIRYSTDGAVQGAGLFVDDLRITAGGRTVFEDGAETPPNGWTLVGFTSVGASQTTLYDNYYIASGRKYVSYDRYLRTGPYNFGFPDRPDYVEHFPYQDGLLISYWDTSQTDNNTSEHPGEGLILPIDAHPQPIYRLDGQPWRPRVAGYDATFGLQKADSFTLHAQQTGQANYIRGRAAAPLFNDTKKYWYAEQPTASVKVPATGTTIRVLSENGTSTRVRVSTVG